MEDHRCGRDDSADEREVQRGYGNKLKGIWGYAPLIVSLANTREVLYMVNRPGNETSHEGCVKWIDRAVDLCVRMRGKSACEGIRTFR